LPCVGRVKTLAHWGRAAAEPNRGQGGSRANRSSRDRAVSGDRATIDWASRGIGVVMLLHGWGLLTDWGQVWTCHVALSVIGSLPRLGCSRSTTCWGDAAAQPLVQRETCSEVGERVARDDRADTLLPQHEVVVLSARVRLDAGRKPVAGRIPVDPPPPGVPARFGRAPRVCKSFLMPGRFSAQASSDVVATGALPALHGARGSSFTAWRRSGAVRALAPPAWPCRPGRVRSFDRRAAHSRPKRQLVAQRPGLAV
jgi:hypothetical protein